MAGASTNKASYSIPKSYKPLMYRLMGLVLVSDALLVILLLMIVGIRNTLGLDASLVWFSVLLFAIKTFIDLYGVYIQTKRWLGVSYFVLDNRLYLSSEVKSVYSVVIELKNMHKATSKITYLGSKKQSYGDVIIEFTQKASSDSVVLRGVMNPDEVVKRIGSEMKTK